MDENKETQEGLDMFFGDKPTDLPSVLSGFTPAPDVLIKSYGYVTALVWGKVWRYCQMADGVCRASIDRLAEELGMSDNTIMRHVGVLEEGGYLYDSTPERRNKPHIYSDTGKIRIRVSVEAQVYYPTESHRQRVTLTAPESHSESDRESLEESIKKERKKELDKTKKILSAKSLEFAILAGEEVSEESIDETRKNKEATDAFERDMHFNPLPWSSTNEWQKLGKFVLREFSKDPQAFFKYDSWRKGKGKFVGALNNKQIMTKPTDFIACWPDFLAHTAMYPQREIRPTETDENGAPISY